MKFPTIDFSQTSVFKFFEERSNNSSNSRYQKDSRPMRISDLKKKAKQEELCQINKISTKGSGLTKAVTILPNDFTIRLGNLDCENLSFDVEGPSYIRLNHNAYKNGKVKVSYRVGAPGDYYFQIKYHNVHVPKSPFHLQVTECKKQPDPIPSYEAAIAYGKGLQHCRQGEVSSFKVDISKTGNMNGRLKVNIDSPDLLIDCEVRYISTKTGCKVEYVCPTEGQYFARVKYNGKNIPGSPFELNCVSPVDSPGLLSTLRHKISDDEDRRRRWPSLRYNFKM